MCSVLTHQYAFQQKILLCINIHMDYICLWQSFFIYGFGL